MKTEDAILGALAFAFGWTLSVRMAKRNRRTARVQEPAPPPEPLPGGPSPEAQAFAMHRQAKAALEHGDVEQARALWSRAMFTHFDPAYAWNETHSLVEGGHKRLARERIGAYGSDLRRAFPREYDDLVQGL